MDEQFAKDFAAPGPKFRSAPFWAWNCRVDKALIDRQLEVFRQMGMGGAHFHVRTGMETEYLSDEYMELIRYAAEQSGRLGMRAFLYDEDRWPSGSAGGKVTQDIRYAARYLLFTTVPYGKYPGKIRWKADERHGNDAVRQENGTLLRRFDIRLDEQGYLRSYRVLRDSEEAVGTCWYVYLESGPISAWMNNHPYVDVMSREAIERFRDVTYERYFSAVGEYFGELIPSIFTDEPQFAAMKGTLAEPFSKEDLFLPWTQELETQARDLYGLELCDALPELLWDHADGISRARYCYHDLTAELFARAYCETLGNWCQEHGIVFTGHLMLEPTLFSQTVKIGEAMRCYRYFPKMPGIDMLCSEFEYSTAKQCQSVLHQMGGTGMASELYGATGWDSDFRKYKLLGDWQAALGVTLRVPHLCWMSMKGEAKRDYPGSLFSQSPWYRKAAWLEDHYARINTAMTRGEPVVNVAVLHPIESYWLHFGPESQTGGMREAMDQAFRQLTETLLFGLIDFDFLSEANLSWYMAQGSEPGVAMKMRYRTVIIPELTTIRRTTLAWLKGFKSLGGRVILLGKSPACVDAKPSAEAQRFFAESQVVPNDPSAILAALEQDRLLDIRIMEPGRTLMRQRMKLPRKGSRVSSLIYQMREENKERWLLIANGRLPELCAVDPEITVEIKIRGRWKVSCLDTLTGNIQMMDTRQEADSTVVRRKWYLHDSLLLHLEPGHSEACVRHIPVANERRITVPQEVAYCLSEPNVCLLDRAFYSLDKEKWHPDTGRQEDLLRLDNRCRELLGMPPRKKLVAQPYTLPPSEKGTLVYLKFQIESLISCGSLHLAGEFSHVKTIMWNGIPVDIAPDGRFVDDSIGTLPLPGLKAGENMLLVCQEITADSGIENFFLLGDFGVELRGSTVRIVSKPETIAFGSVVHQGFPFYTGNITYRIPLPVSDDIRVRVPHYHGALVEAALGTARENIAFSPYTTDLPGAGQGEELMLTLYGNRQNAFGQLHMTPGVPYYPSPDSWRSTGDMWMEEYQPVEFGILGQPEITERTDKQ